MSTKTRDSNIELLRIVSMLLVLGLHVNYLTIGNVTVGDVAENPSISFVRMEFESLCIVCVNLYVLISGYFGIRIKKKSIIGLLFTILFWQITLYITGVVHGRYDFDFNLLQKMIIPGSPYWFVPAYLMLVLFSPILNSFVEKSDKKRLGKYIIAFLVVQTVFGYIQPYWKMFINGYSVISFIGLYLIGSYIRRYTAKQGNSTKRYYAFYIIIATIATASAFLIFRYSDSAFILKNTDNWFIVSYISPFAIAGAVCLFIAFTGTKIRNNIFINRIAASAFPVYLIHIHPFTVTYFLKYADYIYKELDGIIYMIAIICYIISVYFICTILDQLRILAWKYCCKILRLE